jgi:hypothetical protein
MVAQRSLENRTKKINYVKERLTNIGTCWWLDLQHPQTFSLPGLAIEILNVDFAMDHKKKQKKVLVVCTFEIKTSKIKL